MSKKRKLYGSALRAQENKSENKKHAKQVRKQMEAWIPEHLPVLLEGPDANNLYFLEQARSFRVFIQEQYHDLQRQRLAYEYLARLIARGNEEGRWSLDIPSTMMSVPRTRSSRTHRMFKAGIESGKLHSNWLDAIRNSTRPPRNYQDRLADVLMSATYYGGLANPQALTSLANLLNSNRRALKRYEEKIWLELVWSGGRDPLNLSIQKEDKTSWYSLHRFYPDNRTLGLILSLHKHKERKSYLASSSEPLDQNQVWSLIKDRLLTSGQRTTIGSLRAFCNGAQPVTETLDDIDIPQALLECAAGRIPSTSLQPNDHHNWLLRTQPTHQTKPFDIKAVTRSAVGAKTTKGFNKARQSQNKQIRIADSFIKAVNHALRLDEKGLKRPQAAAINELNELMVDCPSLNSQILLHWLIHCSKSLKLSSIYRYHIEISSLWLYHTNEELLGGKEFDELDENELEHVYEQMLASKTNAKSRNYLQGRLQDLHLFASKHYGLPILNNFFSTTSSTENQTQVRTGYIPENYYQAMLASLNSLSGLEHDTLSGLKILLILAYRTGMRRGELLKLRLSDIEESSEAWIYIVNNRYGNNKTDSARRKIPTYLLLLEEEFRQFQHYIGRRRSLNEHSTNTLVFSEPHAATTPHSGAFVSNIIKHLLSLYGLGDLTFHHLRHSALTNLMVALHGNDALTLQLTGYSSEHAAKIRADLYCKNPSSQRDIYSAIAALAGHLTPETTFLHYIHETSLLLWERVNKHDPELNITEARYFSGLSTEYLNKHVARTDEPLNLSTLRPEVVSRLAAATNTIKAIPESENTYSEAIKERRIATVADCYSALKDIEEGDSVAVVAIRYALEESLIIRWLESAEWLQNLRTARGNRRLFPKSLKPTAIGIPLLPAKVQDRTTENEIDKTITQLRELYRKDRESMLWCIQYWIYNSSQSRAGIRFTDPEELGSFIKALHSVIPYSRWHLKLRVPPKATLLDLEKWQFKGVMPPLKKSVKTGRTIQAYLTLRHADEKNILSNHKKSMSQYSSTLLRYVFHMLAIMIGIEAQNLD